MSMLADRKVKQRWHLFPLNNDWVKDQNKFGQKMLEKMGWAPGKGLGAKEQGITEAIRPKINSTQKGLGYNFDPSTVWLEHQGNFSSLLSQLNGGESAPDGKHKLTSLEEKSKNFRKRVHYHKFARGKDLSRCNLKDLSSIFGGIPAQFSEVNGTSVANTKTNFTKDKSESTDDFPEENNPSLTFEEVNEKIVCLEGNDTIEKKSRKKKKKSKKKEIVCEEEINEKIIEFDSQVIDIETFQGVNESADEPPMKRKKKKKSSKDQNSGANLNTENLLDNSVSESLLSENPLDGTSEKPVKRKKIKNKSDFLDNTHLLESNIDVECNSSKKDKKCKKKKV